MENSSNWEIIVVPVQSQNEMLGKQKNIMIQVFRKILSQNSIKRKLELKTADN